MSSLMTLAMPHLAILVRFAQIRSPPPPSRSPYRQETCREDPRSTSSYDKEAKILLKFGHLSPEGQSRPKAGTALFLQVRNPLRKNCNNTGPNTTTVVQKQCTCNPLISGSERKLSVRLAHLNVHSLLPKLDDIYIACITETLLVKSIQ